MELVSDLQYRMLKRAYPRSPDLLTEQVYESGSKLFLLGDELTNRLAGKTVADFGCGKGNEAIDMVRRGAARVIGIDIREHFLADARRSAEAAGVSDRCTFATTIHEPVEIITSIDSFEHFGEPEKILALMASLLGPGGEVFFSFGPTWYHPLGGHLFSMFPWAHLVMTEKALVRWRSDFRSDGATCFSDVEGGLNQMTIRRFERLVEGSSFRLESLECVPIGKLRPVHNRVTREFTTALVRGRMKKR
jgi:SAM-dependent methyltransferase